MRSRTIGFFIWSLLVTSGAFAQSADPAWLDELNFQLAIEEECEVLYYMWLREVPADGQIAHEARAQCADGRQFDATRISPDVNFTLKRCGIEVC